MSRLLKHAQFSLSSLAKRIKAYEEGNYLDLDILFQKGEEAPIFPGDIVLIVGDSGSGKTALMQNITLQSDLPTIYVSPEVSPSLMMRRNMQILSNKPKYYIHANYKELASEYKNELNNFYTLGHGINENTLIDEYEQAMQQINVEQIVLDHMKIMDLDFHQIRGSLENLAVALKKFAVKHQVIIWMVSQIPKGATKQNFYKGKNREIELTDAAEASGLYQIADVGVTISLPNGINNASRVLSIKKGRDMNASAFQRVPFIQNQKSFRYERTNKQSENRRDYVNEVASQQSNTMFNQEK